MALPAKPAQLHRLLHWADYGDKLAAAARAAGVRTVVTVERPMTSETLYELRDSGLSVRAYVAPGAAPADQFEMTIPYDPATHGPALLATEIDPATLGIAPERIEPLGAPRNPHLQGERRPHADLPHRPLTAWVPIPISTPCAKLITPTPRSSARPTATRARVRSRFWKTIRKAIASIPFLDEVVAAYYCALDPETPAPVRATLLAALAYFVVPFDILPDFVLGLGFTDDITVLITAIGMVRGNIGEQQPRRRTRRS